VSRRVSTRRAARRLPVIAALLAAALLFPGRAHGGTATSVITSVSVAKGLPSVSWVLAPNEGFFSVAISRSAVAPDSDMIDVVWYGGDSGNESATSWTATATEVPPDLYGTAGLPSGTYYAYLELWVPDPYGSMTNQAYSAPFRFTVYQGGSSTPPPPPPPPHRTPAGDPLRRVTYSNCHHSSCIYGVSFQLPANMRAYSVRFVETDDGLTDTISVNPYANGCCLGSTTATHWTITDLVLLGNSDYRVTLFYAPRWACKPVTRNFYGTVERGTVCTHVQQSAPISFHLGTVPTSGPGALIGSASASGSFPSASVSATIRNIDALSTITVRVSSDIPGRNVHINWELVCTRGENVFERSGSFDDVTPVSDDTSIPTPQADECGLTVLASGDTNDDGEDTWSMTLKVYKA
jgi:hypothetical protein